MAAHELAHAARSVPSKLEKRLVGSTCQESSNPDRIQLHGTRAF